MGAALPCAASGGAFRDFSYADMQKLAKEDPLALHAKATTHPNWDMGAKITCDSATLMNKALEVRARTVPARAAPRCLHSQLNRRQPFATSVGVVERLPSTAGAKTAENQTNPHIYMRTRWRPGCQGPEADRCHLRS